MSKKFFPILIILDLLLISISIILVYRILEIQNNKIKGIQHINYLNRSDFTTESQDGNLKYFYEPEPNRLIKMNPDWLNHEITYYHNSDGLNDLNEYNLNENNNIFRILTLGDSFTYGLYVDTSKNWPEKLELTLNQQIKCKNILKFDVLNLGAPGYDLEYSKERLLKTGLKYDPDLVIWLVNNWNFDKINEKWIPIRKDLENEGIPEFDIKKGYLAGNEARKVLSNYFGDNNILNYQEKVLRSFKDNYEGNLLIISFSSIEQVYKDLINKIFLLNPKFNFIEIPKLNKNEVLPDRHPNEFGHQKISEELLKVLLSEYFKECEHR